MLVKVGTKTYATTVTALAEQRSLAGQTYTQVRVSSSVDIPANTPVSSVSLLKPAATAVLWTRSSPALGSLSPTGAWLYLDMMSSGFHSGDDVILETARKTGLIDLIANHPNGLALPITEGGRGISGGQLQLISLTRMILAKPSIFILDEPTASMDAATEGKVVALLGELAAEGATLLIATHKTALLPIIDRLLVIQNGKFIIDGPRDLVLAKLAGLSQTAANAPNQQAANTPAPLSVAQSA